MMTSPSTMPAVKVLASQTLMMDALEGRESMRLGATASVAGAVPSLGGEDTYVEASTVPRSQARGLITVDRMVCAMNVYKNV